MNGVLKSTDPVTGSVIWQGPVSSPVDVADSLGRARDALPGWSDLPLPHRVSVVQAFAVRLEAERGRLATLISRETGKPKWEAEQEVSSMVGKVAASIGAQAVRAGSHTSPTPFGSATLRHRPHGVVAVLGPYNFPGHLPNGHIVPALLAGDTVVFKPSEETPATGATMGSIWADAGLPDGVLNVVQGGRDTGAALVGGDIDGLLFTGSSQTGAHFRRAFADRPGVMLALELGGNNPLIAWDGEPAAVASIIAQSAFITAGQRCTCARRLVVPAGPAGSRIVEALVAFTGRIVAGAPDDDPQPAIGSLISAAAATKVRRQVSGLMEAGAAALLPSAPLPGRSGAFLSPAILDVTGLEVPDEEIFGPVLQVTRVADFDQAIATANATRYGLAAGLISGDHELWERYSRRARVGVLNWNRPTTGASGSMPFGGIGASGNHRPSAQYAADYCAYPVASFEAAEVRDQSEGWRGLR